MGEREREREIEGVQDSGTLFKLRRVETSITGGAAAAEPPGTDTTQPSSLFNLLPYTSALLRFRRRVPPLVATRIRSGDPSERRSRNR